MTDSFVKFIENLTPTQLMLAQARIVQEQSKRRMQEIVHYANTGMTRKQLAEAVANSEKTLKLIFWKNPEHLDYGRAMAVALGKDVKAQRKRDSK